MRPSRSTSSPLEIAPLGDSAVIVRLREQFEDAPEETLNAVRGAFDRLANANIPGVIEVAPAYTTVAVFFDPVAIARAGAKPDEILDWLADRIRAALASRDRRRARGSSQTIEIPVCYDAEFGFDLNDVAQHARISTDQVVDLHSKSDYRVNCIGFTPGFPFLGGLPKEIATPRRATPRKEIPAGAVGIGGAQTGIYPLRSPGGWNIIGRTPLRLFDPTKNPPALLSAGDRVRFRRITREQFQQQQQ